jgi:hypothetical protein
VDIGEPREIREIRPITEPVPEQLPVSEPAPDPAPAMTGCDRDESSFSEITRPRDRAIGPQRRDRHRPESVTEGRGGCTRIHQDARPEA